jgi:hypothetical protein
MKKLLIIALPFVLLACKGENTPKEETVKLLSEKDRLSYVLGAMNAKTIVGTKDANIARLDMEEIAKGFSLNFSNDKPSECEATLKNLFGPNYQDFNQKYAKAGAECLGRLTGYAFYQDLKKMNAINLVNFSIAQTGFRHGLLKKDSLIPDIEKQKIVQNFIKGLNLKNGNAMLTKAKQIKGAKVFENGIVMEVVSEGKGASPKATDDVKVEYILTSATGDTIQSSYAMKKQRGTKDPVALKLHGGVIPGWTYALPKMKVGGKYRVYIPWELAYGEQMGCESLCFFIELVDCAKEGTFVKPQPAQGIPGVQ